MEGFTGWAGFVLDARDPHALGEFYRRLTGWELRDVDESWATLHESGTRYYLGFHRNEVHEAPTWPSEPGPPQQQAHLDLGVRDLEAAVRFAERAGARRHPVQPQADTMVMLDPAGHPFCLYLDRDDDAQERE